MVNRGMFIGHMIKKTIVLVTTFMLLFSAGGFLPVRAQAGKNSDLFHKSALGLMPPAYGIKAAQTSAVTVPAMNTVASGIFKPFVLYQTGSWPEAVTGGNFDNDPYLDVAVTTSFDFAPAHDHQIQILKQQGGILNAPKGIHTAADPVAVTNGDFDQDGLEDLAVISQTEDLLSIFFQGASGGFTETQTYATAASPEDLVAGDFNGDMQIDFAVAHSVSQLVRVFFGQEGRNYRSPVDIPFSSGGFNDLAVGDINGDGWDDLAVLRGAGYHVDQVAVFYQEDHALNGPVFHTVEDGGYLAHGLAAGDVNGDGLDDLVVTAGGNAPDAFINVLLQGSDGLLASDPVVYPAYHLPGAVRIADANHDGRNDVLAVHAGWMALSYYRQAPTGSLEPYMTDPLPFRDYYRPGSLALVDVTGDGALDALIANHSSLAEENGLVVLSNLGGDAPISRITSPEWGRYFNVEPQFGISGTANTKYGSLELSTDGGKTWFTDSLNLNWSYPWTVPEQEGIYNIFARATKDGRVQSPPSRTRVIVDRTPPEGNIHISLDDPNRANRLATLTLAATDNVSGVCWMQVRNQNELWGSLLPYQSSFSWTLPAGSGNYTVEVIYTDCAGNSSDIIRGDTNVPFMTYLPLTSRP